MFFEEITQFERNLYNKGIKYIAGIDEVGRGPLAGPFVVASVILNLEALFKNNDVLDGDSLYTLIRDSKKVTSKRRGILAEFIKKEAISYSIESFEHTEVDEKGISALTQLAFFNSIIHHKVKPQYVFTDTFEIKKLTQEHQMNIVGGDDKSISVAAASIVAKVFRDNIMIEMHKKYPVYGFDKHKGYGTKYHVDALYKYGPCEIHRKSFHPIKDLVRK